MILSSAESRLSPISADKAVISAGHTAEVKAGLDIIAGGGNAIDALVAAAFVAFVVEPQNCGVGGYGRLAVFHAESGEFVTIDHYVRGPLESRPDMFELDPSSPWHYYGHPMTTGLKAEEGYLSPAVPGAVAGMCQAQSMFGDLPLAEVLAPAIEAADAGMLVSWHQALLIGELQDRIQKYPELTAFLMPNGKVPGFESPWTTVDRLDTSELAETLRRIARFGPAGFYAGPVAEAIERHVRTNGGILSALDLAGYKTKTLRERPGNYRGLAYITAYDQVAYEALNILECFDIAAAGPNSLLYRHLAAEALGQAFVDNKVHYGDPEYVDSPVAGLTHPEFAQMLAAKLDPSAAQPRPLVAADPWPYEDEALRPETISSQETTAKIEGTTQVAAVDSAGNCAALITSISSAYGSMIRVPGTGVILNNSMQNFDPRPEHPNHVRSGKIPIFAAPSLVAARAGRGVFAAAGSGGYRIETGVLHTFMNVYEHGMPLQEALDHPRVHCQGRETLVDSRIAQSVQDKLTAMGHDVVVAEETPASWNFGRVSAVWRDESNGRLHAAAGPAWHAACGGI
jgi:gamma-glutamyltranspeptidase/glutathione hydrolase